MPTFRKRFTTRIDLARSRKRRQNWIPPLILGLVIGVSACALLVWFLQQDSIGELQPYLIGGAVTFLAILIFRAIFLGSSGKFARKRATGEDESRSTVNLFVALLTGVASFLGMLLLMRQNELMQQQTALSEAARRSSYVMLMDNILNQVNEELKGADTTPYHPSRRLSTVTIGRIAALGQSLRPIRYLQGDTLSRYLSPERGQLLLALVYARLDTVHTYPEIYAKSDFSYADLGGAKLDAAFLQKVDLSGANLIEANLRKVKLREADLRGADLREADLREADLRWADLRKASLIAATLIRAKLIGANLRKADLREAYLRGANLRWADLREADLREADVLVAIMEEVGLLGVDLRFVMLEEDSLEVELDSTMVDSPFFLDTLNNWQAIPRLSGLDRYRMDTIANGDFYGTYYLILPKNK